MKYLRTKNNRIIENKCGEHCEWLCETPHGMHYYTTDKGIVYLSEILEESDTLETLFDEFMVVIQDRVYHYSLDEVKRLVKCVQEGTVLYKDVKLEKIDAIYGAIWVTKENGALDLISVAKVSNMLSQDNFEFEVF